MLLNFKRITVHPCSDVVSIQDGAKSNQGAASLLCMSENKDAEDQNCEEILRTDVIVLSYCRYDPCNIPVDTNRSQRGILRAESRIFEPQAKPSHQRKHKIRFGTVLVRDYDIILGDHPCCSYGPPITIDWNYHQYEPLDVNVYEFNSGLSRKSIRKLCMNYYERIRILSEAGFTDVDFKVVMREINRAKVNRNITRKVLAHYPVLKVETAVESAHRKFKRLFKEDHWKGDDPNA
mmetsp:Transcript_20929/g.31720  ORF Transcript_20929/g.31720 Transcript_20929/m.31720 type:complete len:235 (+) Transcript_20929:1-705(+)|eukprot:CAMPEP_0196133252 /NCGR_PEP_ID=MMETSP0910-20130528/2553_1 /TAXON_ID=49265 /ORGANISM="Thalassiosira rotula, Strain GSO102" /LENGTH=234 /DNA_ID=CAMNT_0041392957 /DNA_START=33 /DNA_END=737 /DNA_ORIENTATION=-